MKIGYTEFSFGYAFTENLVRSLNTGPVGAPIFPNLNQEAELGYDIRLNLPACPLFFQYKLPELMVQRRAKEIAQYKLVGLETKFFRMPLMRRDLSDQHQLLIDWEAHYPGKVFYATPCMESLDQFNTAYSSTGVHRSSVFFSPSDIGPLPDDKAHTVAYRQDMSFGYFCSEPKKVPARTFEKVSGAVRGAFDAQRYSSLEKVAGELRGQILEMVPSGLRRAEGAIRQRVRARQALTVDQGGSPPPVREVAEEILVAREVARVGLGLDMLIAQPSSDESATKS